MSTKPYSDYSQILSPKDSKGVGTRQTSGSSSTAERGSVIDDNYTDEADRRIAKALSRKRYSYQKDTFSSVEALLEKTLARVGLAGEVARYRFVHFWPQIVGEEVARRAKPLMMKGSTLFVEVQNSGWAQELTFQKEIILRRLAQHTENPQSVKDLVFRVAEGSRPSSGSRATRWHP